MIRGVSVTPTLAGEDFKKLRESPEIAAAITRDALAKGANTRGPYEFDGMGS